MSAIFRNTNGTGTSHYIPPNSTWPFVLPNFPCNTQPHSSQESNMSRPVIHLEMPANLLAAEEVTPPLPPGQAIKRKVVHLDPPKPNFQVLTSEEQLETWLSDKGSTPPYGSLLFNHVAHAVNQVSKVLKDSMEGVREVYADVTMRPTASTDRYAFSYILHRVDISLVDNTFPELRMFKVINNLYEAAASKFLEKHYSGIFMDLENMAILGTEIFIPILGRTSSSLEKYIGVLQVCYSTSDVDSDYYRLGARVSDVTSNSYGGIGKVIEILLGETIGIVLNDKGFSVLPVYSEDGTFIKHVKNWAGGTGEEYYPYVYKALLAYTYGKSSIPNTFSTYFNGLVTLGIFTSEVVLPKLDALSVLRYPLAKYTAQAIRRFISEGGGFHTSNASHVSSILRGNGYDPIPKVKEVRAEYEKSKMLHSVLGEEYLVSIGVVVVNTLYDQFLAEVSSWKYLGVPVESLIAGGSTQVLKDAVTKFYLQSIYSAAPAVVVEVATPEVVVG